MSQTRKLIAALKTCLKARNMTYGELAEKIQLSEASVKRIFSEQTFTLCRLEQVCDVLGVDFFELAQMVSEETPLVTELTPQQEKALAGDAKLFTVFILLLNEWTAKRIVASYDFEELELVKLLAALDRLGLIELQVNNRVRMKVAKSVAWRSGGPIRQRYEAQVRQEFFQSHFNKPDEKLCFEVKELSAASLAVMHKKMDRLTQDFVELAKVDASLVPKDKISVGLLVGSRPWVFSVVSTFKRN